jgi:hypothetical protein
MTRERPDTVSHLKNLSYIISSFSLLAKERAERATERQSFAPVGAQSVAVAVAMLRLLYQIRRSLAAASSLFD